MSLRRPSKMNQSFSTRVALINALRWMLSRFAMLDIVGVAAEMPDGILCGEVKFLSFCAWSVD